MEQITDDCAHCPKKVYKQAGGSFWRHTDGSYYCIIPTHATPKTKEM